MNKLTTFKAYIEHHVAPERYDEALIKGLATMPAFTNDNNLAAIYLEYTQEIDAILENIDWHDRANNLPLNVLISERVWAAAEDIIADLQEELNLQRGLVP